MKKSLLIFASLIISAIGYAQTDTSKINKMPVEEMPLSNPIQDLNNKNLEKETKIPDTISNKSRPATSQDKVFMEGKNMMIIENGIVSALNREIKMNNGTLVYPNGVYVLLNGTKLNFKNGDQMTMDGTLIQMK